MKSSFVSFVSFPISLLQNAVVVCRESRREALMGLENLAGDSMRAWLICIGVHIGKYVLIFIIVVVIKVIIILVCCYYHYGCRNIFYFICHSIVILIILFSIFIAKWRNLFLSFKIHEIILFVRLLITRS